MANVRSTSRTPDGQPAHPVTVVAELVTASPNLAGYLPDGAIVHRAQVDADPAGRWSLDLTPNSLITPAGTHYALTEYTTTGTYRHTIVVPTGGPHELRDVLAVPPPPPAPLVPIGGGGAVTSVDDRTGAVSLADRYAPLAHTHTGYAATGHVHDERYAQLGHAHPGYADAAHTHDSRYAALAHDHPGYAPTSHLHDERYAPLAHDHDTRYDARYAALGHAHAGYAVAGHLHDDRYPLLDHTHPGYALAAHDHDTRYDARYAQLGHTHAGYAAAAHTHDAAALVSGVLDPARLPLVSLAQRPIPGRWSIVPPVGPVTASMTLTLGELFLVPFLVHPGSIADQFSVDVSPSAVGASIRFLIYGATAAGQPAAQLADLGLADASSTGAKLWAPSGGTYTFTAPAYWFGLLAQGAAPGVRAASTWHPLVASDVAPSGTGTASAYGQAGVGTTPPPNFTGTAPRSAPRVAVRWAP
ncbi:hypothetical protein Lfu02_80000 [Longispora fulva]|uniref:Uncharacterized protein n=1 Tax=Longispora fulva TaxID=619741 RepID=A0A8J7KZB6_9ACTN|nr:hypothetical protein [Longispora fulva]MBG6140672.1 hypothetical protein [Longispora fulva]GIG63628.1 hypothetical protein Lfu02_80000 [Longispora fulva]